MAGTGEQGTITALPVTSFIKQKLWLGLAVLVFLPGLIVGIIGLYYYNVAPSSKSDAATADINNNSTGRKPHIIFILADDLGWNDVGFHGSSQIPTPHIDALAGDGVILNSYYAQTVCTPSRAAFLTGKYPIRYGLQNWVLTTAEPRGLDVTVKILPQYLQEAGYKTHLIGKWHVGFYSRSMTPMFRGFDSFFGYYFGASDFYHYTSQTLVPPGYIKFDLWDDLEPAWNYIGQYSTELFTRKAVDRIMNHNPDQPLFLFISHMAPHWASFEEPVQVPQHYVDRFPHIIDEGRRKYAGMVASLDDSVGEIVAALKAIGLYDNSIVVFSSDNGGSGQENGFVGTPNTWANNFPLRGAKTSQWEGGLRVTACLASPLLEKPGGRVSHALYHITDWFATFLSLARIAIPARTDGFDIWNSISKDEPSPRTEILHQADSVWKEYALRWQRYKLIIGSFVNDTGHRIDQWYSTEDGFDQSFFNVNATGAVVCEDEKTAVKIPCAYTEVPCLYDLVDDPCEYRNIAEANPDVVRLMLAKLRAYNETAVPSIRLPPDPRGLANLTGGVSRPWVV